MLPGSPTVKLAAVPQSVKSMVLSLHSRTNTAYLSTRGHVREQSVGQSMWGMWLNGLDGFWGAAGGTWGVGVTRTIVQRDFGLKELLSTIVSLEARYGMCVLPESMARMHSCNQSISVTHAPSAQLGARVPPLCAVTS